MDCDSRLIQEIQNGCEKSFKQIVDKYGRLCVHFFCVNFRLDIETARDLTQETFIRVYKSSSSFQLGRSFRPWLMGICRNIGISHVVSAGKKKTVPDSVDNCSTTFESDLVHKLSIESTIRKLPERQAEIVLMRYFWELTCAEIAQTLSIPAGTVKSELYYARLRLMELLESGELANSTG